MANYLASDGLHLDNVGYTKNRVAPGIYGSIVPNFSATLGGTYIELYYDSGDDEEDDTFKMLFDRSTIGWLSFAIRRA